MGVNGARVYFRQVDNTIEILGYSNKDKSVQNAVINRLRTLYEEK